MGLKERIEKIKDNLSFQKKQAKIILKTKWDIGAEQGKNLKEQHKEKLKRKKNENQRKR